MRKHGSTIAVGLAALAAAAGCGDAEPVFAQEAQEAAPAKPTDEDRYLRALELLEIERKPAEAATAFREIAESEGAVRAVRGRATVGLARAERLLGHKDTAETLLRDAIAKFGDVPSVAAQARDELALVAGTRTRFATGMVDLRETEFLDLDTGGVFNAPETPLGGRAELARRGDDVVWFAKHDEAPEMEDVLAWIADVPWWRMTTDGGRTAWVQQLPSVRPAAFRFVVRMAGTAAPLPAPKDPFCVGVDARIDVRFIADARYARYRVERRTGPTGIFEPRGEIDAPPFSDHDAKAGVRYGYRITGITKNGDESLPATVQGTTKSRGVLTGSIELVGGRGDAWFDFLSESVVPEGGDVALHNSYGGGEHVGFLDAWGRPVLAASGAAPPRAAWSVVPNPHGQSYIATGEWISVLLRGGGIARCRVTAGPETWHARLDYEVEPDSDTFDEGPRLGVEERLSDAIVRVASTSHGAKVEKVLARDPRGDARPDELPVADGAAVDPKAGPGSLREYTAVATDAFGRRSVPAKVTLNRLAPIPVDGTFQFRYQQSYSFDLGRVVDGPGGDVAFSSCAGGISSITLAAPGGIVSLLDIAGRDDDAPSSGRLMGLLVAADPEVIQLGSSAQGNSHSPTSDVFVMRTRNGGWARLAITERAEDAPGGWTKLPATIAFTYNPREPVFGRLAADDEVVRGVRLASGAMPRRPPGAVVVDGNVKEVDVPGVAGGKVPDSTASQEVLFALARYRDADKATYSFAGGTRDDLGGRFAVDLRYGVARDRLDLPPESEGGNITDLGAKTWEEVAGLSDLAPGTERRAGASFGHAYVAAFPRGTDLQAVLLRVVALVRGERVAFEYATLSGDKLTTSPGFAPSASTAAALEQLLRKFQESRRGGFVEGPGSSTEAARTTRSRLANKGRIGIGVFPSLGKLIAQGGLFGKVEIDPAAQEAVDAERPVEFRSVEVVSYAQVIDALTRQAGVSWTITETGAIRIVPTPK